MKRRNFLQWAALAAAQSALPALGQAPDLAARVSVRRQGDELLATVELVNQGPALEVLIELGDRPALEVQGELTADGQAEQLVPIELGRRETFNRAGPRRVWKQLPPLGRLEAGTFRFLCARSEGTVSFQLLIQTDRGPVHARVDQVKLAEA
ncbi:MAG: hypothetical protein AMXMBFR33_72920 [Candidatus Xenobia bacterium]